MKLFDDFEAVRFPEENLLFITNRTYLYYIYDPVKDLWRKHRNAGNDNISVANYQEVTKEEIMDAMGGIFPSKETDFMRLCNPGQLWIRDMMDLLKEDYPDYMSEWAISNTIHEFLLSSNICYKSYLELRKLLDNALKFSWDNECTLGKIKELSYTLLGKDIFEPEIGIIDGHDSSSYFWIMPVKILDYSNTADLFSVDEMRSLEISIEEDDVYHYLSPFLFKHFDEELEVNKKREGVDGFEWYLEYNYYTFESMNSVLEDIRDTMEALTSGRENEFTEKLKKSSTYELLYCKRLI